MVTKNQIVDAAILLALVVVVATFITSTPTLHPLGFTASLERGSSNIQSDTVITFTSQSVKQPNGIYLMFNGLTSKNVNVYKFDYKTGEWSLWYTPNALQQVSNGMLSKLDPCVNAKWDGNIWETKILVSPVESNENAVFSYTTADAYSDGYADSSCWNPAPSSDTCHWQGKSLRYGDSVCMDKYLMVCYAGDAGTNALGFKIKSCSNGCQTDMDIDSQNPRGYCVSSPPYCYTIPNDATIAESVDATNCGSRGGQWNWCQNECDNAQTCYDGIQDQDETGVDCGGVCAATCPDVTPKTPSCYDGIQNQGEEGIDCGGPCDACETYPVSPTCYDHIKNQGETHVDCGGPCQACSTRPDIRPATIPNQHDCVYQSLPTLTISADKECPLEYICPITQEGFLSKADAIQDCGGAQVNGGINAPSVLVNEPASVYRDMNGVPICPTGAQPQFWEDVNNACMPKPFFMGMVMIFLIAVFGYAIGKNKKRRKLL